MCTPALSEYRALSLSGRQIQALPPSSDFVCASLVLFPKPCAFRPDGRGKILGQCGQHEFGDSRDTGCNLVFWRVHGDCADLSAIILDRGNCVSALLYSAPV